MTGDWDGTERRAAVFADRDSRSRESVQVPVVALVVGFAAVVLLQLATMVQHALLADDHNSDAEFRRKITCFVAGSAQGKTGADLLTACEFLELGG